MIYVKAAEFLPSNVQRRDLRLSVRAAPTTNSHVVLDGRDAPLLDEQDDSALGGLLTR